MQLLMYTEHHSCSCHDSLYACIGLAMAVSAQANFGVGDGDIILDDVSCVGSEENIFDCQSTLVHHNCWHSEDIGIQCSNDTLSSN